MLAAVLLAGAAGAPLAHAEEEATVKLGEPELREKLFTAEVVSQLNSVQSRQASENGTLALLETKLIDRVQELHPLDEASAHELGALLASVHAPEAGPTLSAAIEDLNALIQKLGLAQSPQQLTPLLQAVRIAAKDVSRGLLQTATYARPGSFDPYAGDLFWWLGPPGSAPADQVAVESAFNKAQRSSAFEGLLTKVLGVRQPPVKASYQELFAKAGPPTQRMAEKMALGTQLKDIKIATREARFEVEKLALEIGGNHENIIKLVDDHAAVLLGDSAFVRLETAAIAGADRLVCEAASIAGEAILSQLADPAALILSLPSIISTIVSLATGAPSTEEIILEQLKQIQEMIQQLGKQVQAGFAHVDQNLAALGQAIQEDTQLLKDITSHVGALTNDVAQIEEKLNQLEANQFEIAKAQREEALVTVLNTYIGYSERTPGHSPLPLAQFEQAAGTLFTYGSYDPTNAISELPRGAWPTQPSEIAEKLSDAASTDALDFNLDFLAAYADGGGWGAGLNLSAGLPNPAVWANGARAFAQLLLENPQYVTEPLLKEFGRLKEVGGTLVPELAKLTQHGSSSEATGTGSSVLNHALENYLTDGGTFFNRMQAEERYFLSQQDPGKEGEPNCAVCTLARAPEPGVVGDTGKPFIELWSDAEQTPSPELTALETSSGGGQPEEGGAHTPAMINLCNHKAGEGFRLPGVPADKKEAVEKAEDEQTAGALPVEVPRLLKPLANLFTNAWHLGLGHTSTCYQTHRLRVEGHSYSCNWEGSFSNLCSNIEENLIWSWVDNETGKRTPLLTLSIIEPLALVAKCEKGDYGRRMQLMWHEKESAEKHCLFREVFGSEEGEPGEHPAEEVQGFTFKGASYEHLFDVGLSELENLSGGKFTWAMHSNFEVPGTERYAEKTLEWNGRRWTVSEQFAFQTLVQVHKEVEDQLRRLRFATYRDLAPREITQLSAAGENVRKAAATLNGGRVLLNDYIELGLPVSVTNDATLGKLVFGPGHLVDNSPGGGEGGGYEIYEYLTKEIEHEEEEAERLRGSVAGAVVDPAQEGSPIRQRLSGRLDELRAQLTQDVAKSGGAGAAEVSRGDQLVPKTLADLELAQFTLLPTEAPHVSAEPVSTTVLEPAAVNFTAEASGGPEVQWEVSTDRGKTFTPDTSDPGNNSDTLTVEPTKAKQSGNQYRASFTNSVGTARSEAATLSVIAREPPRITRQPAAITVTDGDPATFVAEAAGSPNPTVQWEVSSDGGKTFSADTADPGNTATTLTVAAAKLAQSGYQYRARFNNVVASVTSEPATLTVHLRPNPAFTIEKTQEIRGSGAGYSKSEVTGAVGQTVLYRILVRNTGNVPLKLTNFVDASCANLAGGPGVAEVAPGEPSTWTCERTLAQTSAFVNEASVEGVPPAADGFPLMHVSNAVVAYGPTPAPTVETGSASEVGQRSAALNAAVNPRGGAITACKFEYGTATLGSSVSCSKLPGSGAAPVAVSATAKGLAPATSYHFRVSATNRAGTSKGLEGTFRTLAAAAPAAETGATTEALQRTAQVTGMVNPNGGEVTTCKFEYGTNSFASSAPCAKLPGSGTTGVTVLAQLKGLAPNTAYRYRLSATSLSGTSKGAEATLKTIVAFAPTVQTGESAEVLQRTALVAGSVNPNGGEVTTCKFEYGTSAFTSSTSCASLPGAGTAAVAVTAQLRGLTANTAYRFRVSASSPSGTSKGGEGTFTTTAALAPTVQTQSASEVTEHTAILNATVNPNGGEVTTCKFEYGTSSFGTSVTCAKPPGLGTAAVSVSAALKGLLAHANYRFRISATSLSGTSKGAEGAFKT